MAQTEIDRFTRVAEALSDLQRESLCRVVVQPGFGIAASLRGPLVQFVVNRDDPRTSEVLAQRGLQSDDIQLAAEIGAVLSPVVDGISKDKYAANLSQSRQGQESIPEEVSTAKYETVERLFDIASLRRRAWVKKTSKTSVPVSVEWEVSQKLTDESEARPGHEPVNFGTLRFVARSPRGGFFDPDELDLTMDVDEEDVLVMLDVLSRLRDALNLG